MVNIFKSFVGWGLFLQFGFFVLFLGQNYSHLDNVTFVLPWETGTTFEINYLAVIIFIIALLVVLALLGIQVLGSGLSDNGQRNLGILVYTLIIYTLFMPPSLYYLGQMGDLGVFIIVVFNLVYIFFAIQKINDVGGDF